MAIESWFQSLVKYIELDKALAIYEVIFKILEADINLLWVKNRFLYHLESFIKGQARFANEF